MPADADNLLDRVDFSKALLEARSGADRGGIRAGHEQKRQRSGRHNGSRQGNGTWHRATPESVSRIASLKGAAALDAQHNPRSNPNRDG